MSRAERRRAQIAARKAATKARLAQPLRPPKEPVALPWRRRGSGAMRRTTDAVWSLVVEGGGTDVAVSLGAVAAFVSALGPGLKGRR